MRVTDRVREIVGHYTSDNPGTKGNLVRMLMSGKLAGTGRLIILPVDQGFEHGPARSFAVNPLGYDPEYHVNLAIEAGLSAYAAPLGMIEVIANQCTGSIPLILKMNSSNSLSVTQDYDQAITGSVKDAVKLGCSAVGFTIYPGSSKANGMIEEIAKISSEAKAHGLAVVIWSYPRGSSISKKGESAVDVIAYSAHIAALLGAHIIKVKLPANHIELPDNQAVYTKYNIQINSIATIVKHVMDSTFAGKRIVLFSGGANKDLDDLYCEARAIKEGGGHGSIIGRNTFQRSRTDALKMLAELVSIYS